MDRIDQMRAYVRVVDTGSFTAAARQLRVGQSTVSKWLAATEDEIGVRLLDRTTRTLRITDAGQRFYDRAREIVLAYDDAIAALREGQTVLRGRIRMSLPVVFGPLHVVPLVAAFAEQHQALEIEMDFGDRYVRLIEEGFDVAVRVGAPVDSSLVSHALGTSRRRLVASPAYLRNHRAPKTPKALSKHQTLAHTRSGSPTTWAFSKGGKSHRVLVRGRVSANSSQATLELTRRGMGISLLAAWLVDTEIRAGRLIQLLADHDAPKAPVCALTPPGRRVAPSLRMLIQHLRVGLGPVLVDAARVKVAR